MTAVGALGLVCLRRSSNRCPWVDWGGLIQPGPASRRSESQVIIKVDNHLVGSRCPRSFAIGDVVEYGCRLG
jgi:hypothetical protein